MKEEEDEEEGRVGNGIGEREGRDAGNISIYSAREE